MTPARILRHAIDPALDLLPDKMTSPEARAMLLAIALQESRARHRRQIQGPAKSYWQFERVGVLGVLQHAATRQHAIELAEALDVDPDPGPVHEAIEHQDILAAGMARLLLWTLPDPLPDPPEAITGWEQYLAAWRPGRPRPETWAGLYRQAWEAVDAEDSKPELPAVVRSGIQTARSMARDLADQLRAIEQTLEA